MSAPPPSGRSASCSRLPESYKRCDGASIESGIITCVQAELETTTGQAPAAPGVVPQGTPCPTVEYGQQCGKPAKGRGLCSKHYQRWMKYGDPLAPVQARGRPPEERFWSKVDKDGPIPAHRPDLGQCWVWTGGLMSGYGAFWLDGRNVEAHIVSYTWECGEIAEGQERDHLCRNRACVRPGHLEAVDHWTNVARGISPHGLNAAKDRCRNGHEFTAVNTRINSKGARVCVTCANEACRRWWAKNRATAKAAA